MEFIGRGEHESVAILLDSFHEAARVASKEAYFACFHSHESRFLGTDSKENWTALEFLEFAGPYFDAAKEKGKAAWEYTPIDGSRKVDIINNIAYFDELMTSVSFKATTRGNGVAIRSGDGGKWTLLQYHLSFPIPNPIAVSFCNVMAEWEDKQKAENPGDDAEKILMEVLVKRRKKALSEKN